MIHCLTIDYSMSHRHYVHANVLRHYNYLCNFSGCNHKAIAARYQVDILISKNQALQIYLKHHDNVYKTP